MSYTKAKVSMYLLAQISVFRLNEFLSRYVCILNGLSNDQALYTNIQSITDYLIGFLLAIFRIHQQSPACHHVHILILPANIYVYCLSIDFIIIALDVEFVQREAFSTLNEYWEWILKEGRFNSLIALQEFI
jgi:hypothetical protein